MSGPVSIGSPAEWQTLLTDTNVVIADCTFTTPPRPPWLILWLAVLTRRAGLRAMAWRI